MWGFVLFKWWSFRSVAQHCRKFVVLRVAVLRCRSETHSDVVLHSSLMLPWQPYTAITCNAPRNLLKSCTPAASFWMQQVGNFDSSDFKAVIKKTCSNSCWPLWAAVVLFWFEAFQTFWLLFFTSASCTLTQQDLLLIPLAAHHLFTRHSSFQKKH